MQRTPLQTAGRPIRSAVRLSFLPVAIASVGAGTASTLLSRLQQSDLFREYGQAFEAATGLPLVLTEPGPFQTPLQGATRVNPFCASLAHGSPDRVCPECLQLQQRLEKEAKAVPKVFWRFAGLSESAVPVQVGEKVLGYLQTGQVFFRAPTKKQFKVIARTLAGNEEVAATRKMVSTYFRGRVVTRRKYDGILRLLAVFARQLATTSNHMLIADATVDSLVITKGRAFIIDHQTEALSLGDVARAVNMSAWHFCKVFKKATGLSFTEFLSQTRIESVKQMLLNTHTRVSEAGFAAGFQSLSQFNRVFRRVAGEAPSSYRGRIHGLYPPHRVLPKVA